MFSQRQKILQKYGEFQLHQMMRYSQFVPRLYNLCLSFGFTPGKIMPSRAFCSDESQGFPIILIAKHFGAFPFNHGRVGGVVATDRHAPHANHGKDLVMIQASHVGYDPDTQAFGRYSRLQTEARDKTPTCGKLDNVLHVYQQEYIAAQQNIHLRFQGNTLQLVVVDYLLDDLGSQGLFLNLSKLGLTPADCEHIVTDGEKASVFSVSDVAKKKFFKSVSIKGESIPIGNNLRPEFFYFRRNISIDIEGHNHLESNLLEFMPWILTSHSPLLEAAKVNTQIEFDRTVSSIVNSADYLGKNILFVSCLNIDISPEESQLFPLTKCVPWAAYVQFEDGTKRIIKQNELVELLMEQSLTNPDQIDLEWEIQKMIEANEIRVRLN